MSLETQIHQVPETLNTHQSKSTLLLETENVPKDKYILDGIKSVEMLKILIPKLDETITYEIPSFIFESMESIKLLYDNSIKFHKSTVFYLQCDIDMFKCILLEEQKLPSSNIDHYEILYNIIRYNSTCVCNHQHEKVKLLIEIGVDVNKEFNSKYRNTNAMREAICASNVELVKYFISIGGDIYLKRSDGNLVIDELSYRASISKKSILLLDYLLEIGYDINRRNLIGNTYFLRSVLKLNPSSNKDVIDFMEVIVDKGVDLIVKDHKNMNALHYMFKNITIYQILFEKELIDLLIKNGLSINDLDDKGRTPIHRYRQINDDTCENYDILMKLLIDNEFDFNAGKISLLQNICVKLSDMYELYEMNGMYDPCEMDDYIMDYGKLIKPLLIHTNTENIMKVLELEDLYEGIRMVIQQKKCIEYLKRLNELDRQGTITRDDIDDDMDYIVLTLIPLLDIDDFRIHVEYTQDCFYHTMTEDHGILRTINRLCYDLPVDSFNLNDITDKMLSRLNTKSMNILIDYMFENEHYDYLVDAIAPKSYHNFITIMEKMKKFEHEPNEIFYKKLYDLAEDPNDIYNLVKYCCKVTNNKLEFEKIDGMVVLKIPECMLPRHVKSANY